MQIGAYDADRFLKAAIAKIKATVTTNQPIKLMELGTFAMHPNAPRVGRNPATGAPIDIPAHWSVSFKIDKAFKQTVEALPLDNQAPGISMVTALGIIGMYGYSNTTDSAMKADFMITATAPALGADYIYREAPGLKKFAQDYIDVKPLPTDISA